MSDVLRYKDVVVSKGSDLYKALEDKKPLEAARIYWECEVEFQKYWKDTPWGKPPKLAEAELKRVQQRIEEERLAEEHRKKDQRRGTRTLR